MDKEKFIRQFTLECQEIFGADLVCLLLVGSTIKNDVTPFSDIDFVAVIKKFSIKKLGRLRKMIAGSSFLIDFAILFMDEVPANPENFILGTHGCYYLELVIKRARCLCGTNLFIDMEKSSDVAIKASLYKKMAEYVLNARRIFVESNRSRSIESNHKLNHHLIKLIKDFLYIINAADLDISTGEAISLAISRLKALLSHGEKKALCKLKNNLTNDSAANLSEGFLAERISIMNKINRQVQKIYGPL